MNLSALVDPNVPDYKYMNYYIAGGCAYTVDHYLVHKLFVYKIPRKTSLSKIRDYFSQYDVIKGVRFFNTANQQFPNVAFVHFESPAAAARVLNFYHKNSDGKAMALYCVKVCDSWHQPSCQLTKESLNDWSIRSDNIEEEDQFASPNRDSILVLNDDCLENIIRLMPISSQLIFARSCSRICKLYEQACKSLYRTLIMDHLDNLTKWELKDFFNFSGAYIIRIEGRMSKKIFKLIVEYMCMFCTNLEEVVLHSDLEHHSKIDAFLMLLNQQKQLKILKLSTKFEVFGRYLENLSPTIEVLSVECSYVKDEHIITLCDRLTNLKELYLGLTFSCSDHVVQAMIVSCKNLETLTVYIDQSNHAFIAKLPNLKSLTLTITNESTGCPSIFTQLVEEKSHLLKILRIRGTNGVTDNVANEISGLKELRTIDCPFSYKLTDYGLTYFCDLEHLEYINLRGCDNITNKGLVNLIIKCKKLKRLNLEGCHLITNDLVFDLIKKMQQQIQNKTFMRSDPVLLMAWFTKLDDNILNAPEYIAASHLVIVEVFSHK